jgi:GDP-D-mannose dehydratase
MYFRKNDIPEIYLNPQKANDELGWISKNNVYDVIDKLIDYRCKKKY